MQLKKIIFPYSILPFFSLSFLGVDYGENRLGAGTAEGEDSAQQFNP